MYSLWSVLKQSAYLEVDNDSVQLAKWKELNGNYGNDFDTIVTNGFII